MIRREVLLPFPYNLKNVTIGIDPGSRNLAVAVIFANFNTLEVYEISAFKEEHPVVRADKIQRIVEEIIGYYSLYEPLGVVEGASYGKAFGQVELAEARIAAALALYQSGVQVGIVPPLTIRKAVFKNGRIKNPWNNIPDNSAAAIGCAYYLDKKDG